MPQVIFLPDGVTVDAQAGKSLLDLAFENDILIEHNCGGLCACTSCRVIIREGLNLIQNKSEEENHLLSEAGFTGEENRLSCCCKILNAGVKKIIVEIPKT
ncbi:MAG: 2Fe-2S iron-sulfur cluster binding domain-containing protein [Ignavibacteriae bacterium]|nr:2Fe-2S iron-sulfur cluster binding domain-containing protein [Ignavibacteriota bacterium]